LRKSATPAEKSQLLVLIGQRGAHQAAIDGNMKAAFLAFPALENQLKATTSDHLAAGDELVDLVSRGVINAPEVTVASQDLADAGNRAVASGFRLYDESSPTLGAILKERISGARSSI